MQLSNRIENFYNVRISFNPLAWEAGHVQCDTSKININNNYKINKSEFLKIVLHEVGHIHCYRNNIFKNYHLPKSNSLTKKEIRLIYLTGLRAERYVDNWAGKGNKKLV